MNERSHAALRTAFSAVLAVTTLSGTLVFACMMPFAAIAALSALVLPTRRASMTVGLCWLGNQMLGFGLLGYPWDGPTVAAGLSLLCASLIALSAARAAASYGGPVAGFAGAIAAFELSLFAYALGLGDPALFTPQIVALVVLNEALWFAGLWLGWQMLLRLPGAALRRAR